MNRGGDQYACDVEFEVMKTIEARDPNPQTLSPIHVSVIIPTLNESKSIDRVLSDMSMERLDEIILVDSSNDNTAEIARKYGVRTIHEIRRGYGRALETGIENAKGDIIVYIDGDYTYDPKDIPRLLEPIINDDCDVVLGNRLNGNMQPGAMRFINRVGNMMLSLIFSSLFLEKVNDTQCGLRAISRKFLEGFSYRDYGMPYVTEQLIKLVKRGARVGNISISYRTRIGKTKLRAWVDGLKILNVIIRERFLK